MEAKQRRNKCPGWVKQPPPRPLSGPLAFFNPWQWLGNLGHTECFIFNVTVLGIFVLSGLHGDSRPFPEGLGLSAGVGRGGFTCCDLQADKNWEKLFSGALG